MPIIDARTFAWISMRFKAPRQYALNLGRFIDMPNAHSREINNRAIGGWPLARAVETNQNTGTME